MKRLVFLASVLLLAGCSPRGTLPSYGVVPDFTLIDHTGQRFDSRIELDGKVWLASCIFTTCAGPCPRMNAQFKQIRAAAKGLKDFRLVSITIDPARDTPEVLARIAKGFGAERSQWVYLTGAPAELSRLTWDTFHLAKVDGSLEHSTRFVLVDRQSRIRGYYDSRDTEGIPALIEDIKELLSEKI